MSDFSRAALVEIPQRIPPAYPPTAAMNIDANGDVIADSRCRKCAYNLRGLPMKGRCPECGTPVEFSIQGDLLRFSDPAWVVSLQHGAYIVFAAVFVSVVQSIIIYGPFLIRRPMPSILVMRTLTIAASTLYVIGTWLLTAPDPSGSGEDRYGYLRKIVRLTLIIYISDVGINIFTSRQTLFPSMMQAMAMIGLLGGAASVIGVFARFGYFAQLSMRIPDTILSRRARILMYGLGISNAFYQAWNHTFIMIIRFSGPRSAGSRFFAGTLEPMLMIVGLALLIFTIIYLIFLWKFASQLSQQARLGAALSG